MEYPTDHRTDVLQSSTQLIKHEKRMYNTHSQNIETKCRRFVDFSINYKRRTIARIEKNSPHTVLEVQVRSRSRRSDHQTIYLSRLRWRRLAFVLTIRPALCPIIITPLFINGGYGKLKAMRHYRQNVVYPTSA